MNKDRLPRYICTFIIVGGCLSFWAWILFPCFFGARILIPALVGLAVALLFSTSCWQQYGHRFPVMTYVIGLIVMGIAWLCMRLNEDGRMLASCLSMQALFPVIAYGMEAMNNKKK